MVIVQDFECVALDDTNDGAGEVGGTVIGIHACFEVRPHGGSETHDRQHKGDGVGRDHVPDPHSCQVSIFEGYGFPLAIMSDLPLQKKPPTLGRIQESAECEFTGNGLFNQSQV